MGDDKWLKRYYEVLVNSWYIRNLIVIGPHTQEDVDALKQAKFAEIMEKKEAIIPLRKEFWKDFQPRAKVVIAGENVSLMAELETLSNFINLEMDPVRRTALIELAMKKKNIDIESLPKTPPEQAMAVAGRGTQQQQEQVMSGGPQRSQQAAPAGARQ